MGKSRERNLFFGQIIAVVVVWVGFEIYFLSDFVWSRLGFISPMDVGSGYNTVALQGNSTRVMVFHNLWSMGNIPVFLFYFALVSIAVILLVGIVVLFKRGLLPK